MDILSYLGLNSNHFFDYSKTESPIEGRFLNHFTKFLHQDTELFLQEKIETISGNFRPDILLIRNDYKVIIECDGRDYHSSNEQIIYDEWRDALLITQNKCDVIYRVKGVDITHNLYDIVRIIYNFDSIILESTYCQSLSKKNIYPRGTKKVIEYPFVHDFEKKYDYDYQYDYSVECDYQDVEVIRKDLFHDFENYWLRYVIYSLLYPNKSLNYLLKIMQNEKLQIDVLIKKLNNAYKNAKVKNTSDLLERYRRKSKRGNR